MSDPFIGEIRMVGFSFAPRGWALCEGQLLPIAEYQALFSLLSTTYGGDGRTTFGLPDLRGRSPVGVGMGPGLTDIRWGETAGKEAVTIQTSQMPSHTHVATTAATTALSVAGTPSNASPTPSTTNNILGASPPGGSPSAAIWSDQLNNPVALGNTQTANVTLANTGGSQPLPLRNPFVGTNFIIALLGEYPTRA